MNDLSVSNLMSQKRQAKSKLADQLNFKVKRPLLAIILDNELSEKSEKILNEILKATTAVDIEVVVLADSNLDAIALPHTYTLTYSQKNRKELLTAADMALSFDFSDIEEMLLNGTIPISPKRTGVEDYDPSHESGNSFMYREESPWGIFAALVRALETFKLPYDWKGLIRNGLQG